jgi:succinyl-diaminopimelate desuccinylase
MPNLKLLCDLIKFKTHIPEEKEKCVEFLEKYIKSQGLKCEIFYGKVPNLIVTKGEGNKKLGIVVHYDVVPAEDNEFIPKIEENKLFGRGSADCKGPVVCALEALINSNPNCEVNVYIAGGEETGESKDFFEEVDCDLAIVVDTGPYISIGASGFMGINIKVKGKGGHSSMPFLCDNPIYKVSKLIEYIKKIAKEYETIKSKYFGPNCDFLYPRITPTIIKGGEVINVIPDEVYVYVNARPIIEFDNDILYTDFTKKITEFCKEHNINIEISRDERDKGPWVCKSKYLEKFKTIFEESLLEMGATKEDYRFILNGLEYYSKEIVEFGGTDGDYFYRKGIDVIQFGPMRPENNIHGKNEFVYIQDLEFVYNVLKKFIERF